MHWTGGGGGEFWHLYENSFSQIETVYYNIHTYGIVVCHFQSALKISSNLHAYNAF